MARHFADSKGRRKYLGKTSISNGFEGVVAKPSTHLRRSILTGIGHFTDSEGSVEMVQLTGDFVTSLGMIAIRFIQGAQAIPNDPFHALSARRVGGIDVIGKYGKPAIGGLFALCAQNLFTNCSERPAVAAGRRRPTSAEKPECT